MDKNLFSEFKPVSTKEWLEKINNDLKGAPFDKLIWKTINNFNLNPFYRNEDLKNLSYLDNIPGEFPYNRGNNINYKWYINEEISCEDIKKANAYAIKLIKNGITSLTFYNIKKLDFDTLLKNIDLSKIEINIKIKNSNQLLTTLKTLQKLKLNNIKGSFFCDNITDTLFTLKTFSDEAKNNLINAYKIIKDFKNYRLIAINGINFTNAGTSTTQEIAFTISAGVEYINFFTDKKIKADDIIKKIQFNLGIGSDYFIEIAKIRAIRFLWAKICESYKVKKQDSKVFIHSQTSNFNKTIYDKYVNILRTTTEAMSAIIGGTDSLNIINFDKNMPEDSEFAQRISKNIQIIIKEEAYFDKITDPSAGSYYIENITDKLIEKSWDLFLDIENQGGFLSAIDNNFIKTQITDIQTKRLKNVETRKEIVLGTNQYPNLLEKIETPENIKRYENKGSVKTFRKSQEIEKIRLKTDKSLYTPKVYLFTYGNLAMRKARAMFATNFFGVAGFKIIDNTKPNNIIDGINEFNKTKADLFVICSSDDEYLKLATEISKKINPDKIVIAGYPKNIIDDLQNLKIQNFIHTKSNLVKDLTKYQNQILKN